MVSNSKKELLMKHISQDFHIKKEAQHLVDAV